MLLRPINLPDDYEQLVLGVKDFIARMDYHDFLIRPDTDEDLIMSVERFISLESVEVLVVEYDNELIGGIGMIYAPCIWNPTILNAEQLFFWVSPTAQSTTALQLLRGAMRNAQMRGCSLVIFRKLTSNSDKLHSIYQLMGLRVVETTYMGPC